MEDGATSSPKAREWRRITKVHTADNTGEGRRKGRGCFSGVMAHPIREPFSKGSSMAKEKSWTQLISIATRVSLEQGKRTVREWSSSSFRLTRANFIGVSVAEREC